MSEEIKASDTQMLDWIEWVKPRISAHYVRPQGKLLWCIGGDYYDRPSLRAAIRSAMAARAAPDPDPDPGAAP